MEMNPLGKCPKCPQGWVVQGKFAWNCHRWKEGCDFKIPPVIAKKQLTESHVRQLLKKKKTKTITDFHGKNGLFDAALRLTDNFQIEFSFDTPPQTIGLCPQCGEGFIEKKAGFYGCSQHESGCHFKIWKTIAGKTLKDTHAKSLLKHGRTELIKGFKGRYGKFDAFLRLNDQGAVVFEYAPK